MKRTLFFTMLAGIAILGSTHKVQAMVPGAVPKKKVAPLPQAEAALYRAIQSYDYSGVAHMVRTNTHGLKTFLTNNSEKANHYFKFAIDSLDMLTDMIAMTPAENKEEKVKWSRLLFNSLRIANLLFDNGVNTETVDAEYFNKLLAYNAKYRVRLNPRVSVQGKGEVELKLP